MRPAVMTQFSWRAPHQAQQDGSWQQSPRTARMNPSSHAGRVRPRAADYLAGAWGAGAAGFAPKSTLGATEIAFSFSTVNCGFSFELNIIAVRLEGNCLASTL